MSAPKYLSPPFQRFQKEYDAVVQCNRCGFCETVCPTYVVSGKETLSPRGRNQAFRQILEGKIQNPETASEIFSTCLTCHACTNVCFSQVPVAKLMAQARAVSAIKNKISLAEKFAFGILLYHRRFLSVFLWIGFLIKRMQISSLLKKTGVLKWINTQLDAAEELVDRSPLRFGGIRKNWRPEGKEQNPTNPQLSGQPPLQSAAYFSGCGIHYLFPETTKYYSQLLTRPGCNLLSVNHSCCGLPAHSAGDIKNAKRCAEKNVKEFSELGTETILVNDDSCAGFMKGYGELLDGDLNAVHFSNKVKNLSEFLIDNERYRSLPSGKGVRHGHPFKITYHDPCQMGNGFQAFGSAREILKKLPGVDFVEMEEANWCCGGAGTYCLKHPHLAEDVLERKLLNIKQSRAQAVVTQASSCLLHIQYGLKKKGWDKEIQVLHLAEFLAKQG